MHPRIEQLAHFDEFVTTKILRVVYLAGTALIALGIIAAVFGGVAGCVAALRYDSARGALGSMFLAVLYVVGGLLAAVLWRVYCEVLMVVFKINDNLQAIKDAKH